MENVPSSFLDGCDSVETVTLESTVKTVSSNAFYQKYSIKTVKMTGVETIREEAFYDCTGLKNLDLGNNLKTIGNHVFYNCISLASVVIPDSVTKIENNAFRECTALKSITFGKGITDLGESHCIIFGCHALESITFNAVLTKVNTETLEGIEWQNVVLTLVAGQKALSFESSTGSYIPTENNLVGGKNVIFCDKTFKEIVLTGAIDAKNMTAEQIGTAVKSALDDGATIIDITLPSSATEEHFRALSNALAGAADGSIELTVRGATQIPNDAFAKQVYDDISNVWVYQENKAIGNIAIGKEISTIYELAFDRLPKLLSIGVVEDNTSFKSVEGVLYTKNGKTLLAYPSGNTNKHFELQDGVETIRQYAFNKCDNLTSVSLANNVSTLTIEEKAFYICTSLKEIVLGNNVRSVPQFGFNDCTALESIIMLGTTDLTNNSFGGDSIRRNITLTVAWNETDDTNYASYFGTDGKSYRGFNFKKVITPRYIDATTGITPEDLENMFGAGGNKINGNITLMIRLPFTDGDEDYTRNSLNNLRDYFDNYIGAYTVDLIIIGTTYIPDRAEGTLDGMFHNVAWLSGVTLGETVYLISANTFNGCGKLTTVDLGGVEEIGPNAFEGCTSLVNLDLGSVKEIRDHAFFGCTKLATVTIPKTVQIIASWSFKDCAITEIHYAGTKAEWQDIMFASDWNENSSTDKYTVHFGDGTTENYDHTGK